MSKRMADFYSERLLNKANKPSISEYLFDKDLGRNHMSKFNVGDRFEIEIAEVFKGAESGNDKYRIKGAYTFISPPRIILSKWARFPSK